MKTYTLLLMTLLVSAKVYSQNLVDSDGLRQDRWEYKNKKGHVIKECYFVNDTLNGEYISLKNGDIVFKANYKNGILHGEYIIYDSKNSVAISKTYNEGTLVEYCSYWRNKKIRTKALLKNGLMHGESITYYKSGEISSKLIFRDGKILSALRQYGKKGNIKLMMYPRDQRDKFISLVRLKKDGTEKSSKSISEFPYTYYLLGESAHSKGTFKEEIIPK